HPRGERRPGRRTGRLRARARGGRSRQPDPADDRGESDRGPRARDGPMSGDARRSAGLIALVAASAVVRLLYCVELNRGPCIWQHRWADTDMNFFDAWARIIVAGDWLTDRPLHARGGWNDVVAHAYLAAHPEELGTDGEEAAAAALWDR